MEQILLAFGSPKETVAAIMMHYKNTKVKVDSPEEDIDLFDNFAGVLQGCTLAPHLFIIWLSYVFRMLTDLIKEHGFTLKLSRSRRYSTQTITDADDMALLANTPTPGESQLHNLGHAVGYIGVHVNADKTEYICFNQKGDLSTLYGGSRKQHLIY